MPPVSISIDTMEDIADFVRFTINGKVYKLNPDSWKEGPQYRLVDFIRDQAGLKGTKTMCREGGCGACTVSVSTLEDPTIRSINSCLTPVLGCDGWDITTVEGLGNQTVVYHPLQQRLVKFGGTQCGFCSPGMIMNMHGLMTGKKFSVSDVEKRLDGNICRCTGYRPILDAFKSFACDASVELKAKVVDIEDVSLQTCPLKKSCSSHYEIVHESDAMDSIKLDLQNGQTWIKPRNLETLLSDMNRFKKSGTVARLVAGNTSTGIYKNDSKHYKVVIDISRIPELRVIEQRPNEFRVGGAVTMSKANTAFETAANRPGFEYSKGFCEIIERIGNSSVRNVATLAGNLMLKHAHHEFPSDLFTILDTVGASISIVRFSKTSEDEYQMSEFLDLNMKDALIISIHFPAYTKQHVFRGFKITQRYQNSQAQMNAGFLMKIGQDFKILEQPRIVYGGISPEFTHAHETEAYLAGKSFFDKLVIQNALNILELEVKPHLQFDNGAFKYKSLLCQSLLYKYILGIVGTISNPMLRIGGHNIRRNVSSGKQSYQTDKSAWPLNKPVLKLESIAQVSGSAEYINDIDPHWGELFGAFVLSTKAKADISMIDPAEALKMRGVVRFVAATDIPGENNYMPGSPTKDEIFAKSKVQYAGQPVGLILADTREIAFRAAKKVKVLYRNIQQGVVTIKQGIEEELKSKSYDDLFDQTVKSSKGSTAPVKHYIKGEFEMGSQYHFQMETQVCICVPKEDGLDVFSATQSMDHVQAAIAASLGIQNNEINIQVRRLGGAFGSKISRATHVATACALAAHLTKKPVRVALDLETNMEMIGKRPPYLFKYEVGVDDDGKILFLHGDIFCGVGISANEESALVAIMFMQSLYRNVGWKLRAANIFTNTAPNTWCRAPGSLSGIAMIENVMEHISFAIKKDPLAVRMANLLVDSNSMLPVYGPVGNFQGINRIPKMVEGINTSADYQDRLLFINNFNKNNRWRKRGMALLPMRYQYPIDFFGNMKYPVYVAIYKNDGSVVVSHGGIEMGQGINTKIAQTVAYELGIPIEIIKVKPSNNVIAPNTDFTGGSVTSEFCCQAALLACRELKNRMLPVEKKFKPKSWEELVHLCNQEHVDLTASHMPSPKDGIKNYHIWIVNLTEVEIDVLTGEYKIVRVDILQDAGKSLNPAIDIGQIEGALVMGLGYWTTEKLSYDERSGQLLTNRTTSYKPPLSRDIPEDMRITLLKDAENPYGVLGSKATGEPTQCSSVAVLFALKNAIYAARKDAGLEEWFQLDGPVTPEDVLLRCGTSPLDFLLNKHNMVQDV